MAGKITCQTAAAITWDIAPDQVFLQADRVHVWRVNYAIDADLLSSYEYLLNAEELQKANRFFKVEDRKRYIITRAALRIILSKYLQISAIDIAFILGENKKPRLAGLVPALYFNVSHSGSYSVIGISKFDLGIDVEFVNNQFIYSDIVNNYFNKKEADFINSSVNPAELFFTYWTRKEAVLKAISMGLNATLQSIPCLDGEHLVDPFITDKNWVIKTFNIDHSHVGSIAVDERIESVSYFNLEHQYTKQN